MESIISDVQFFFSSGIGIVIQILAFCATVIPGLKWVNQRLDNRIEEAIDEKFESFKSDVCKQLSEVSNALANSKTRLDTEIEYINKAIDRIQGISRGGAIRSFDKQERLF